ncbi:MAG: hypothetical protein J7502_01240 [Flavisolibacter sp.]|nr:hypothetical protein [Flavisolibacter sp.]
MSKETLISIAISIIVGIVLSYWGIWYSKRLKDKYSLSLVNDEWISLLTTFQDKFEALKIEFTQPINTNLDYYRASILNTGTLDIDKTKMYAPLEIIFPENCKVNECKIGNQSSNKFSVSSSISKNKICFEWDLLKPQEYFSFECIIESTIPSNRETFRQGISVSQRIADLKDVQQINAWNMSETEPKKYRRKQYGGYLSGIFFLSFCGFLFYNGLTSYTNPDVEIKYTTKYTADNALVELKSLNSNTIVLLHNNKADTVALKDAPRYIHLMPSVDLKRTNLGVLIFFGGIFLLIILGVIKGVKGDINELRKIKLINNLKNNTRPVTKEKEN